MKYIWIVVAIALIGGLVVIGNKKDTRDTPETPLSPQEATLVGPQEPVPTNTYDVKAPLSKNKIILKDGMKIEITQEGSGTPIVSGQTAVMSYVGKLENGVVFDASKNHGDGTFSFILGTNQVIQGWEKGVLGMKVGESRTLTIPGELAYGSNGIPGVIPPNATLIFDISLLIIK